MSSVVQLLGQFMGPFLANFPAQILLDGVALLITHGDPTCARLACSLISDSLLSGTWVINGDDHGANCSGES
jgi:hypothetical protein